MMRRIVLMATVALVMAAMMAVAGPASATIHPIVESFDCVESVPEGHPTGDVASPPGQTIPQGPAGQNVSRAESLTSGGEAFSSNPFVAFFGFEPGGAEHKLDGKCGKVGH